MSNIEKIYDFGPKIAKYKLSAEDTKELYKICLNGSIDMRHELVAYIKDEKDITDSFKTNKVFDIIKNYCNDYIYNVDSGYYINILNKHKFDDIFNCNRAWYNRQVHMEYNPIHNHERTADLVTVMYPKITIDNDVEHYIVNKTSTTEQTGQINWQYGQSVNTNGFGNSGITLNPEEGDLFIFPGSLLHYTTPVLGNSERYSISCNWLIHTHIKRLCMKEHDRL